ncbi:unnamed protein product [Rhizophagus irregularis]|nr:unnamed protein product [Rhizophagus irregularis]
MCCKHKILKNTTNLTLSCDGWTNSANKNILNYHSQLNKKKKVSALKEEAKTCDISDGGLKKWVDTRWHTMYDCVDSIMRHKTLLENL